MNTPGILTDEHIPGPLIASLRSLGYDVRRARDEFEEGTRDGRLLAFARNHDRITVTCDKRFTVVDGEVLTEHAGVIYAEQTALQVGPADAAAGIDRIVTTITATEMSGNEFYLNHWMD